MEGPLNDKFAIYFKNKNWRRNIEPLEKLPNGRTVVKIPQSNEVQRINRFKNVQSAEKTLKETNQQYKVKVENLKKRIKKVKSDQENLKNNLVKFNNFVKEKRAKVALENKKREEELLEQKCLEQKFEETKEELLLSKDEKERIQKLVIIKKCFKDYLQSFIEHEISRSRYKDIDELMKRCEALISTRDDLHASLDGIKKQIHEKEALLHALNRNQEEQISRNKKVRAELSAIYTGVEKEKTKLKINYEKIQNEKVQMSLLMANIKLSLQSLWQYVQSRQIVLPNESKKKQSLHRDRIIDKFQKRSLIEEQIAKILAHIIDLKVVISLVENLEDAENYLAPAVTEKYNMKQD